MKIMKSFSLLSACLLGSGILAMSAEVPDLPAPKKEGGMPLMDALKNRATQRSFSDQELSPEMLSQLLWAAQGLKRDIPGFYTSPKARRRNAVEL